MREREVWRNLMPKKMKRRKLAQGFPIVRKIFKDLMRERSIIFAIALQVFIILSSSLLMTNSVELFTPDEQMQQETKIAISGERSITERLSTYFDDSYLEYGLFESEEEAMELFSSNSVDGVISIRRGEEDFPIFADLYVPQGDVKTSLIMSETKNIFEVFENDLREENLAEPDAIMLNELRTTEQSSTIATQIFESLYSILIPFLILMPGVLLGGMVIDILIEELERKTLNLLMLVISFRRYIFELIIATLALSMAQVIAWQMLITIQGIKIANLPQITLLVLVINLIMFIMSVIITLAVMDKTKAQLIYSFMILILFASMPLFAINPVRVISRLAIGIVAVPTIVYSIGLSMIAVALFIAMIFAIKGKEW